MKLKFYTPKELKERHEAEVAAVNVNALTRPYNDARSSAPKKMKDFSPWVWWKSLLVGLIGVAFVFLIWQIYAWVQTAQNNTLFLSSPAEVWRAIVDLATSTATLEDGSKANLLWEHIWMTFSRVLVGYFIALGTSIPIAFLMAWYRPVRSFLDPFIQFLRCIPPIAYVPLVVAAMGINESAKYFIIFLACFLTMTVTIYQGVRNVDLTLVKAAYTFGAKDRNLFGGVIVPSAFPFILTAMRLGVGAALTTVVAAELTGATYGLGALVNSMAGNSRYDYTIAGIILLGLFGILFDRVLLFLEKRLTRWK